MTKRTKEMTTKPESLEKTESTGQRNAKLALQPSVNAASVIQSYQGYVMGKDTDLNGLVEGLRGQFGDVKDGDLSQLEAMLIGQATALQSIFTSCARRSQVQESQRNLEAFLSLALKAQSQSRATIQAVIELKYPRQVAYVAQANISNGPQQVNNGHVNASSTRTRTHAGKNQIEQNKLLEDSSDERTHLDSGATATTVASDPAMETMGTVDRTKKRGG